MTKYFMIENNYVYYKSKLILQFGSITNKNIKDAICNPAKTKIIP